MNARDANQMESWNFSESIDAPRSAMAAHNPRPGSRRVLEAGDEPHILVIEDSVIRAKALARQLKRQGLVFRSQRVDTPEALRASLLNSVPDLVLSALTMSSFDGLDGLKITREVCPDVPFVFFSGTITEQRAVELLQAGATDCVRKPDLGRIALIVERALRDADTQAARRQTEEQLRKLSSAVEHSPVSIIITDTGGMIEYVNPKFVEVSGYSAEEVCGQNTRIIQSEATAPAVYEEMWRTVRAGGEWHGEIHNQRKNGELYLGTGLDLGHPRRLGDDHPFRGGERGHHRAEATRGTPAPRTAPRKHRHAGQRPGA